MEPLRHLCHPGHATAPSPRQSDSLYDFTQLFLAATKTLARFDSEGGQAEPSDCIAGGGQLPPLRRESTLQGTATCCPLWVFAMTPPSTCTLSNTGCTGSLAALPQRLLSGSSCLALSAAWQLWRSSCIAPLPAWRECHGYGWQLLQRQRQPRPLHTGPAAPAAASSAFRKGASTGSGPTSRRRLNLAGCTARPRAAPAPAPRSCPALLGGGEPRQPAAQPLPQAGDGGSVRAAASLLLPDKRFPPAAGRSAGKPVAGQRAGRRVALAGAGGRRVHARAPAPAYFGGMQRCRGHSMLSQQQQVQRAHTQPEPRLCSRSPLLEALVQAPPLLWRHPRQELFYAPGINR